MPAPKINLYLESREPPGKSYLGSDGPPLGIISPPLARPHPNCNVDGTHSFEFNNLSVTAAMELSVSEETSNPLFTCSDESDPEESKDDPITERERKDFISDIFDAEEDSERLGVEAVGVVELFP